MIIGKKYRAKNTYCVKNNDLIPGEEGYVTFVDGEAISLWFKRINKALKIPKPCFGLNFTQEKLDTMASGAFQESTHYRDTFRC